MSDTAKRDAVLARFGANGWGYPYTEQMADRIVELEAAAERVRALHAQGFTRGCCKSCKGYDSFDVPLPCPTLRALDRDA